MGIGELRPVVVVVFFDFMGEDTGDTAGTTYAMRCKSCRSEFLLSAPVKYNSATCRLCDAARDGYANPARSMTFIASFLFLVLMRSLRVFVNQRIVCFF